jgi:hypothetical protein
VVDKLDVGLQLTKKKTMGKKFSTSLPRCLMVLLAVIWLSSVHSQPSANTDFNTLSLPDSFRFQPSNNYQSRFTVYEALTDSAAINKVKKRTLVMGGIHAGLYTGSMLVLNEAWYKDYPKDEFHTFNDIEEWLQVDKVGHTWSAYQLSRMSYAGWRWTGMPDKKAVWLAGASGFGFQTVIEILDGFSKEWGWSWGDFAANTVGSGLFVGQHLAWNEERISFKFGFHKMTYDDPQLNKRSDELFGASLPERMLKDYNGQTYWLSANLKSFFKQSKLPPWLNMAVGYGATGMFGGTENIWTDPDTNLEINRGDIPRRRQFYLAPDIDFTRIKTNKKWVRSLFYALNAFKLPAPALMLSKGKLTVHGFYF